MVILASFGLFLTPKVTPKQTPFWRPKEALRNVFGPKRGPGLRPKRGPNPGGGLRLSQHVLVPDHPK